MAPLTHRSSIMRSPAGSANAANNCGSIIKADKDSYHIKFDMEEFNPNEITVKVTGKNTITIKGIHKEKDDNGSISHHFVRRYVLPKGYDINYVTPSLSSDGIFSITTASVAPKESKYRVIPIQQTGVPSKPIQKKTENKAS